MYGRLEWNESKLEVSTLHELDSVLDELERHAEEPLIVFIPRDVGSAPLQPLTGGRLHAAPCQPAD